MKISLRTADQLVLVDSAASLRGVGAFVAGFGALWIFAASRDASAIAAVIGALAIAGGLALILLPRRTTAAFDKPSRTLVITRRSLRGRTQDEVDLAKIATVDAAASPASRGIGATWRVVVTLQNGTAVPLTDYSSSSPSHAIAATAVRGFLALPEPAAPADTNALPPALAASPAFRTMSRAVPIGFALVCSLLAGTGVWFNYQQAHKLSVARPAEATVLSRTTEQHRSSGRNSSVTWRPVVSYRYEVDGQYYSSDQVTPLRESRSGHWADDLIARYPVGSTVTAWYDPAHPGDAYLVHEWSWLPAIFTAFPILVMLGVYSIWKRIERARIAALKIKDNGL